MSNADVTRISATGQIQVASYEPTTYDQRDQGPALVEIQVSESFTGDITGEGEVRFLQTAHPDGTALFVTSALRVFATEFDDHTVHGACDACARRPVLVTPRERTAVA